jgi:hypothetical protein
VLSARIYGRLLFFFELQNLAIVIVTTAGAEPVRQMHFIALGALGQIRWREAPVRVALVAACFGCFIFGYTHVMISLI